VGRRLDETLAVLNGVVGDHLARTGNELVTRMSFAHEGRALTPEDVVRTTPPVSHRAVVLVHGLMSTESIWAFPDGTDYGSQLARDLGVTPFYVRYNSGLPVADNGLALAHLLDELIAACAASSSGPLEEMTLLGYSMGGLVVRSACHEAAAGKAGFLRLVRRALYVGTPHLGAPYERLGRVVSAVLRAVNDPVTRLIADIADLRSAGLQDLGDADIRHEDRKRRSPALRLSDWQHPVPLLPQIDHYLVAGSLSSEPWLADLFGDALVPVPSALAADAGGLRLDHVRVLEGRSHVALAHDPEVYVQLCAWVGGP